MFLVHILTLLYANREMVFLHEKHTDLDKTSIVKLQKTSVKQCCQPKKAQINPVIRKLSLIFVILLCYFISSIHINGITFINMFKECFAE